MDKLKVKFIENVVKYDADNNPVFGAQAGEVMELPFDQAQRWLRRNKCEMYEGADAGEVVAVSSDPVTLDEVIDAIAALDQDNADLWTASGLPQLKALEALVGNRKVNKELRDLAWLKFQQRGG